jgi:hypothetical protein
MKCRLGTGASMSGSSEYCIADKKINDYNVVVMVSIGILFGLN